MEETSFLNSNHPTKLWKQQASMFHGNIIYIHTFLIKETNLLSCNHSVNSLCIDVIDMCYDVIVIDMKVYDKRGTINLIFAFYGVPRKKLYLFF